MKRFPKHVYIVYFFIYMSFEDDILLLCITGMNEIINLKTICTF